MKTCNRFVQASSVLKISFAVVLLGIIAFGAFTPGVFAQGRINAYTVQTSFSGAGQWNDLSNSGSASYIGDEIFGYSGTDENGNPVNTTLPFNFKYDNTTISSGSTVYVGAGAISFQSTPPAGTQNGGLASASYPEEIYFWGGAYSNSGAGVDIGEDYYGIYTETDGVAPNRVFTIQENDVHSDFYSGVGGNNYGSSSTAFLCSMQVKIYESSGVIQMLYQNHNQDLGGYGDPNNPYYYGGSYYQSAIGLNGLTSPSFQSLTYESSVYSTPSTDLQFSPPAPPQELSLTPNPKVLNFGTTTPQLPVTMFATVKSVGGSGSTLHITGYNITGSNTFTVTSGPPVGTAIPVGSSVQYGITFLPLSNGNLNATFNMITDGVDSGKQSMSLSGIGAVPNVSYSSNSMFRGVDVELTDTSKVQYLYVNSTGGGPLTVNSVSFIGIDSRAYFITHVPVGAIQAGGVDSIGVRFVPDLEGIPDAHMVINSSGVNNPWDTVAMFGVGILPHLAIDSAKSWPLPTTVNFDSVKIGSTACMSVQLTNPGSDTVAITRNYFESADFDFSMTPLTGRDTLIPPGGAQTIQICFTPLQRGTRVATLHINTNIPHTETTPARDTSQFTVNIIGTGVPTGKLVVSGPPTNGNVMVGDVPGCVTDTFWNIGATTLIITSVTISGGAGAGFDSGWLSLPQPIVLAPNSYQTFSECATPTDSGAIAGTLTTVAASSDGTSDTATLPLRVYGLLVADTAFIGAPLPSLTCQPDTDGAIIQVYNTGNVTSQYTATISGTNAADFTIQPPTTSGMILPGQPTSYQVIFNPTLVGNETANMIISNGTSNTTIVLIGTGGASTITGSGTAPTTVPNGSVETFIDTVTNTGTCEWEPGPAIVQAPFAYVSGGNTYIQPGGTELFTFTFTPPGTTGTYTQMVTFPNSIGTSVPAAVDAVSGTVSSAGLPEVASSNGFSLDQNYPNPFSGTSQLEITLPVAAMVHLSIIDVQGQVVQTVLNQHFDAGTYGVTMNADGLASGTYYYQMTAGDVTLTRQMVVIK